MINRGDIVLTRFPFTDLSGSAVRPALVVSHGHIGADVIVIGISSVVRGTASSTDVIIEPADKDFAATGLKVRSAIRVHKVAAIEKKVIVRRLGALSSTQQTAVDSLLRQVLGL